MAYMFLGGGSTREAVPTNAKGAVTIEGNGVGIAVNIPTIIALPTADPQLSWKEYF